MMTMRILTRTTSRSRSATSRHNPPHTSTSSVDSAGCEFSTDPGPNASEILVGPVKNCVISVKLIDYSGKLPSGPVGKTAYFAA